MNYELIVKYIQKGYMNEDLELTEKGVKKMEMDNLFERVRQLTSKYPNLNNNEVKELRMLSNRLSGECSNIIYDMEVEQEIDGI